MESEPDARRIGAAAFLADALGIDDDPVLLADDLVPIDDDPVVAVFAAEVDSSIGPAAFLVYAYALAGQDETGRLGQARFDADLAVLDTAAARGAPGPRAVAHASVGDVGFVLATSPAVLRALVGDGEGEADAGESDVPAGDPSEVRRSAAEDLVRLLRAADERAAAWLAAVRAAERPATGRATEPPSGQPLPASFSAEETALALLLLEGGTRNLLLAFEAFLAAAREQTARGTGHDPTVR